MTASDTAQTRDETNTAAVLAKIDEWPEPVRIIGQRVHQVITEAVPGLKPRIWYGMPGYAKSASAPVLLFFRHDEKFSFGLTEKAHLEPERESDGYLISSAWYFDDLDETTEKRLAQIVRRAAS